jgi:anti-anti-sigma factor
MNGLPADRVRWPISSDGNLMSTLPGRVLVTAEPDAGGTWRITVSGDLDVSTAADFRDRMTAALTGEELHLLQLDLEQVEFIDVAGLRQLIQLRNCVNGAGRRLEIVSASPAVDSALTILGIGGFFGYSPPR